MDDHLIQTIILNVLSLLLLLSAITFPPNENILPLKLRLMPNFHGHGFQGRDVFGMISNQPWLFWRNTGETPRSFLRLVADVSPIIFRLTVRGGQRIRQRRQKINIMNQILLVLMWLRKYPHSDNLALWFDIDPSSVVRIIHRVVPELWQYFSNQITWPNAQEWINLRGNWPDFPNTVGAIDSTPHEIYCPSTEPQRLFYSGHRHYHCMHTQLVVDNQGHLRFVQAGFLGSTHDARSYRLMVPVNLPPGLNLLADRAYPDGGPLTTPVRAIQMHLLNRRERRRARKFNRALSRRRIKVEHVFKEMKTYKSIGSIWRHPRWLLPTCVELVAFLAERRVRLFENI